MKITYKDKEYELKYSFRALMIYENITNKSFQPKSLTDLITLFYSMMISSTMEPIDYNEFLDWLDDNPDELNNFSAFILGVIDTNNMKSPTLNKNDKKKGNKEPKN